MVKLFADLLTRTQKVAQCLLLTMMSSIGRTYALIAAICMVVIVVPILGISSPAQHTFLRVSVDTWRQSPRRCTVDMSLETAQFDREARATTPQLTAILAQQPAPVPRMLRRTVRHAVERPPRRLKICRPRAADDDPYA
jgi:hypothetical protein